MWYFFIPFFLSSPLKLAVSSDTSVKVSLLNFVRYDNFTLYGSPESTMLLHSPKSCVWECVTSKTTCLSVNIIRKHPKEYHCSLMGFVKYQYGENSSQIPGINHYTLPIGHFSDVNLQNCAVINKSIHIAQTGVHWIRPIPSRTDQTRCDLTTNGGGWTVIQRRLDGSVNFYRGWSDYKKGFGNKYGEYWLGLDAIHDLTSQGPVRLRVELEDFQGVTRYAEFNTFAVANETDKYRLTVQGYTGNSGDSLTNHHTRQFSTLDQDNDKSKSQHCAEDFTGAWWYKNCMESNLNGQYFKGKAPFGKGVVWAKFKGKEYSLKRSEMKIRPASYN